MNYRLALAVPCLMASFQANALQDCNALPAQQIVHCHVGNARQASFSRAWANAQPSSSEA
ncbi:MAG TPA: hypothetical protein DCE25_02310 [Pseudomonas sp.]|nr:hypothetical protein [Pseudomonas sp.]